jgi:hypothetical protein
MHWDIEFWCNKFLAFSIAALNIDLWFFSLDLNRSNQPAFYISIWRNAKRFYCMQQNRIIAVYAIYVHLKSSNEGWWRLKCYKKWSIFITTYMCELAMALSHCEIAQDSLFYGQKWNLFFNVIVAAIKMSFIEFICNGVFDV